jgi:hypothetical protein
MNRDHLVRKCATLVAALALVVFVSFVAIGGPSGILSAIAIGIAVAVALFGDKQRAGACSRPFRRRS